MNSYTVDGQELLLTPFKPQHHRSYIISTWVRSYWDIQKGGLRQQVYLENEPKIAEASAPYATCLALSDSPETLVAWCVGKRGLLHYLYVTKGLRGRGIGTWLAEKVCGGRFEYSRRLPFAPKPTWVFNPYRVSESVEK